MKTFQTAVITHFIRRFYQKRLLIPIMYLLLLAVIWFTTPIAQLVFPQRLSSETPIQQLRTARSGYILTTLTDLHFTGYTQKILGYTNGYYYYTFQDDQCLFVLLAPATCGSGTPDIERLTVRVHVIRHFEEYDTLTQLFAEDLNWTASGIRGRTPDYLLSEPGFHKLLSFLLLACYFATAAYAAYGIILCVIRIMFPLLTPACLRLRSYGDAAKLLTQAEKEISTRFCSEEKTIFLTENFFIALTEEQVVIIPVGEIVEIHKRRTPHRFFHRLFSASCTLHIIAEKHVHIQLQHVPESDMDDLVHAFQALRFS